MTRSPAHSLVDKRRIPSVEWRDRRVGHPGRLRGAPACRGPARVRHPIGHRRIAAGAAGSETRRVHDHAQDATGHRPGTTTAAGTPASSGRSPGSCCSSSSSATSWAPASTRWSASSPARSAARCGCRCWSPSCSRMLTAASYAELVTKYPRAGGSAVFAERAYRSRLVSFLVGYCMLAAGVTSAAGLALAFGGDYLGRLPRRAGRARGGRLPRARRPAQRPRHQGVGAGQRGHDRHRGLRAGARGDPRCAGPRPGRRRRRPGDRVPRRRLGHLRRAGRLAAGLLLLRRLRDLRERRRGGPRRPPGLPAGAVRGAAGRRRGLPARGPGRLDRPGPRRARRLDGAAARGRPGRRRRRPRPAVQRHRADRRGQRRPADHDHVQPAGVRHGRAGAAPPPAGAGAARAAHAVGRHRRHHRSSRSA